MGLGAELSSGRWKNFQDTSSIWVKKGWGSRFQYQNGLPDVDDLGVPPRHWEPPQMIFGWIFPISGAVERCLENFFEKVGRGVGTHPVTRLGMAEHDHSEWGKMVLYDNPS